MSRSPTNTMSAAIALAYLVCPCFLQGQGGANPQGKKDVISGFHLVLLLAHNSPDPALEGIPQAVVKALQDVAELLPFKSYSILDSALIRGSAGGTTQVKAPARGAETRQFIATIETNGLAKSPVHVLIREESPMQFFSRDTVAPKSRESTVILDSTFVIEPSETVVVGTSRLRRPDNALVAVLTALPPARQPL